MIPICCSNKHHSNFSFQHHVRWNKDVGGVTIWDNGNNDIEAPTANASSGMSIRINSDDSATLVGQYVSPGKQLDSSQGSHQVLSNGNHFLGMGSHPYMYEVTDDGRPVWYARFGDFPIQSYRAYKWEWQSTPNKSEMALFSYSRGCYGSAAHYASWNGATDVASWDYFLGSSEEGVFVKAASQAYNGTFETVAITPFSLYAYAVAYDNAGNMLGQTPTVKTWTPSPQFGTECNDISCPSGTNYTTAPTADCPIPVGVLNYDTSARVARAESSDLSVADTPALHQPVARRARKFMR